jgi:hypothetical protein
MVMRGRDPMRSGARVANIQKFGLGARPLLMAKRDLPLLMAALIIFFDSEDAF